MNVRHPTPTYEAPFALDMLAGFGGDRMLAIGGQDKSVVTNVDGAGNQPHDVHAGNIASRSTPFSPSAFETLCLNLCTNRAVH